MCSEFHFSEIFLACIGEWFLWRKEWKEENQLGDYYGSLGKKSCCYCRFCLFVCLSKAGIIYMEKLGVLDNALEFEPRGYANKSL